MRYNPLKPDQVAEKPKTDYLSKKTIPTPKPISQIPTLAENSKGGFDIRFPTKPSPEILAAFHETQKGPRENEWRWHWKQHVWYAKRNDITRAFAAQIIAGTPPRPVRPPEPVAEEQPEIASVETPENVVPLNFAAAPAPAVPVPAWRSRFLRGTA
jgi:hypothetical protein